MNYIEEISNIESEINSLIVGNTFTIFNFLQSEISEDYYLVKKIGQFVIKIATLNNFHFESMCREVKIIRTVLNAKILPKLFYSYISPNIVIKIEQFVNGNILGENRDDFKLPKNISKNRIIENINKIKTLQISNIYEIECYLPSGKIIKYLEQTKFLISSNLSNRIRKLLCSYKDKNNCFSHGDLIPGNIINNKGEIYFIDWEWCGIRSSTYDEVLFLLFSGKPNFMISRIKNYINKSDLYNAYIDCICIALRELKNWSQEEVYVSKKIDYINMWKNVLKKGVKYVENFKDISNV